MEKEKVDQRALLQLPTELNATLGCRNRKLRQRRHVEGTPQALPDGRRHVGAALRAAQTGAIDQPTHDGRGRQVLLELGAQGADAAVSAGHLQWAPQQGSGWARAWVRRGNTAGCC